MPELEWIPMESNPEVMNPFLRTIGIKQHVKIVDVLGFDDMLLEMVEGKVEGLIMLYPLKKDPGSDLSYEENSTNKLYFMKQTIRNACATMAIIHLVANQCNDGDFEPNSSIKKFIDESKQFDPDVKANRFESCQSIATAHEQATNEGQTDAPSASDSVEYHFICFIHRLDTIYEMDGRARAPINRGPTSQKTFLKDAMKVCESYVKSDPSNPNFSILAFVRDV